MEELEMLDKVDWEIIKWKAHGMNAREIGAVVKFKPKTVKNRLIAIYEKLNVHNSIQMLRKLNDLGVDVWNME